MASICPKCNLAYAVRSTEKFVADNRYSGPLRRPHLLRCGHSVCETCTGRGIKDGKGSFPCPICHIACAAEKDFPQNIYLTGHVLISQETLLSQGLNKITPAGASRQPPVNHQKKKGRKNIRAGQKCRECQVKAATCRCPKCDCFLCGVCFDKIHSLAYALREHQAVQLKVGEEEDDEENGELAHFSSDYCENDIETVAFLVAETPRMCSTHPDRPIEYHCEDDQVAICSRCVVLGEHKHHNISSIEEKNKAKFTDLEEGMTVAKKILKKLKTAEKDLEMELSKGRPDTTATIKEIQDYFLHLHGLLQTREIQLVESAKEAAKSHHEALRIMSKEVKGEWKKLNQAVKVGRRILHKNDMVVNAEEVVQILCRAKEIPCVVQVKHKVPVVRWKPGNAIKTTTQDCGEVQEVGAERVQLLSLSEAPQLESEDEELDEDKSETASTISQVSSTSNAETRTSVSSNGEDVIVEEETVAEDAVTEEKNGQAHGSVNGVECQSKGSPVPSRHKNLPLKPRLKSSPEEVTATHIVSPSQFYVQPCHALNDLRQMSRAMQQHCRSVAASTPNLIQPGDLVLAQFSQDRTWYRARVRKLVPAEKETSADVFYIDYGNSEVLPISKMRVMRDRFKTHPEFSYECCLQDIVPAGITDREVEKNKWSKEACTTFLKMASDNDRILMIVLKEVGGILEVDLCIPPISDMLNDRPVSIRDSLVFLEHAKFVSNYVQPKILGGAERRDYVKMSSKRVGEKFYGIICSPNLPTKFFVQQLGESAGYLTRMSDQMQELYNSKKSELYLVYCPQKDMVCMAKHQLDNTWLRAKVLRLLGGRRVEVLYVDFGYIEDVPYTSLRKLHDHFLRFEPQARMCRLADVAPLGDEWSTQAQTWWRDLTAFKQFAFHVVGVEGNELLVVVHPIDAKQNKVDLSTSLNALCVEEGHAASTGDWSAVGADAAQLENCIDALPPPSLAAAGKAKPAQTSSRARKHRPLVRRGRMAAMLDRKVASISMQQPEVAQESEPAKLSPDVHLEVVISHFLAPDHFHLQVATANQDGLEQLMKDLQAACARGVRPGDGQTWQKEDFCAAEVEGVWYRCCITAVMEEGLYEVNLVDYGGESVVSEDELCPLNPDQTKLRRFAFPCRLAGVTAPAGLPSGAWPSTTTEQFLAIIHNKNLYIKSEGAEEDGRIQLVDLLVEEEIPATALEPPSKNVFSLRQRLLELGVALPLKANSSPQEQHPQMPAAKAYTPRTSAVSYKPHVPPAATTLDAVPTYVDDEGLIYLQLSSEDPIRRSLATRLSETYAYSAYEEIEWCEGYDCVALYTPDNVWARARILSVSGNTAKVLFLEFGNVEEVSVEFLRMATEEILAVPLLSMLATLHNAQPRTQDGLWNTPALNKLHDLIVGTMCDVTIKDSSQGACSVQIQLKNGTDVAEALARLGYVSVLRDMQRLQQQSEAIRTVVMVANPYPDLVLMPVGHYFPAMVTNVDVPNIVYMQHQLQSLEGLQGEKLELAKVINRNLEGLVQLAASINHNGPLAPLFSQPPLPGTQCCAQYSFDNRWYRGLVVESRHNSNAFLVLYVDYGNSEVVSLDRLRMLPRQYEDLPPQAVRCRVQGMRPVEEEWSSAALDAMVALLANTPLTVCITADSPQVVVQLFRAEEKEGLVHLAYESAVQQGLVLVEEEEILPPASPLSNSPRPADPCRTPAASNQSSTPSSLQSVRTPSMQTTPTPSSLQATPTPSLHTTPTPSSLQAASTPSLQAAPFSQAKVPTRSGQLSKSSAKQAGLGSPHAGQGSPSLKSWAAEVEAELSEDTLTPCSSLTDMCPDGSDQEVAKITGGTTV